MVFEPRAQVRRHFFHCGFVVEIEFVFKGQGSHPLEGVDDVSQAGIAFETFVARGRFVSVDFGEEFDIFFAAQFDFGFSCERFGFGEAPLRQDNGVYHLAAALAYQQGLRMQPVERFLSVGVFEYGSDSVGRFVRSFVVSRYCEQVRVVVAEDHLPFVFVPVAELLRFEGFRAAVDDVARHQRVSVPFLKLILLSSAVSSSKRPCMSPIA